MDVKTKENLTTAAVVAGGALAGYALVKTIKVEAGEEDKPDKPKYNLNVLVNPSNSGTVIPSLIRLQLHRILYLPSLKSLIIFSRSFSGVLASI